MGGARNEQVRVINGVLIIDAEVFSGGMGRWVRLHEEAPLGSVEFDYESKGRDYYRILKEKNTDRVVWTFRGGSGHRAIETSIESLLKDLSKHESPKDDGMGRPVSSKYLDVTTAAGTEMLCRLCGKQVYKAAPQPGLDVDQITAMLEHFLFQHQVSREEIAQDCQGAFEAGMRREQERRT